MCIGEGPEEGDGSSCWHSARRFFTSSRTSWACVQASRASCSSLWASLCPPSSQPSFSLAPPPSSGPLPSSASSCSVSSSFLSMSRCSRLTAVPVVAALVLAAPGSEQVRMWSIEAQRFFWAAPGGVASHSTTASRGRLRDFPEASAPRSAKAPSVLERVGRSGPSAAPRPSRGAAESSSWIRSRVSAPSEEEVEAWWR